MPDIEIEEYPAGNVTFVFTDIEDSSVMTRRLEEHGLDVYQRKLQEPHRVRLKAEADLRRGFEIQRQGDGHLFAFERAADALACCVAFQRSLRDDPITHRDGDESLAIRVRVGIHTAERQRGPARMGNGLVEYAGSDTNFAARVAGLGRGGQILLSESTAREAQHLDGCRLHAWPNRLLKSFEDRARVLHEILYHPDQEPLEPGTQWLPDWFQAEKTLYVPRPDLEALVVAQFRRPAGAPANPARWRSIALDGPRIVTLKAEGGMGKTRLAVQCAAQVADLFPDGVHFVPLATTLATMEAVAQAIGQSIGMAARDASPAAVLAGLQHRTALLVLDNYESVEDPAGDPDQAVRRYLNRIVAEAHGLRLLVTGRTAVNIVGVERIIEGPLEAGMTPGEARDLFLDRARLRWGHDRDLTAAEQPHLDRILDLTARIPLAVELAAGWVGDYELREIADGLESTPLGEETGTPDGHVRFDVDIAHGRHDSLTRSLDWSYNLLARSGNPTAQAIFATCGLFAESFDEPTVAAAAGVASARKELRSLLGASLVRREPVDGTTRYRLHRFTREYARQRLDQVPKVSDETRRRFVKHYARLVVENARDRNQIDRYAILDREWRNALAALELARSLRDATFLFAMLPLGFFLEFRGLWSEALFLFQQILNDARITNVRQYKGIILNNMGVVYQSQGRHDEALGAFYGSVSICREFKDRVGEGQSLNNMGGVYHSQGRYSKALGVFTKALAISREFKDRVGEGRILNNMGIIYEIQGRHSKALAAYAEDLAICRESKDRIGEGQTLTNVGNVYKIQGRHTEALEAYVDALAILREHKDRVGEALVLNNMGNVFGDQGRYVEALGAYSGSLAINREYGDRIGEGQTLENLALLAKAQGDLPGAIRHAEQAVEVLEPTEARMALEKARRTLARCRGEAPG